MPFLTLWRRIRKQPSRWLQNHPQEPNIDTNVSITDPKSWISTRILDLLYRTRRRKPHPSGPLDLIRLGMVFLLLRDPLYYMMISLHSIIITHRVINRPTKLGHPPVYFVYVHQKIRPPVAPVRQRLPIPRLRQQSWIKYSYPPGVYLLLKLWGCRATSQGLH